MIKEHNFVREHVPTSLLGEKEVWEALLQDMPMTATIRNLNKMTKIGLFENEANLRLVLDRLGSRDLLRKARIHPLKVLVALMMYSQGKGDKGSLEWTPNPKIVDALDQAYHDSFAFTEPTGKRFMLAVDVSESMTWKNAIGTPLTPRELSAALAMTIAKLEPNCIIKGFSHKLVDLPISPRRRLDDNINEIHKIPMGATDASLPIRYALDNGLDVDCFITLTDNETWCGGNHPSDCLRAYRNKTKRDARNIVIGMTATNFSIADPDDPYSLDMAGFDASMLETISDFLTWQFEA